jgi:hypothetical protein
MAPGLCLTSNGMRSGIFARNDTDYRELDPVLTRAAISS